MSAQPTDVAVLRNATLFSLTRNAWSNYRKADKSKITVTGSATHESGGSSSDTAANRVNVTKKLIESAELDAVRKYMNDMYGWCLARSMPSTAIRRGIYFVKNDQVLSFEDKLAEAQAQLRDVVVPAFLAKYEDAKEAAKKPASEGGLGELYNEDDYPTVDDLRGMFGLKWSWLQLGVPDELPDAVRGREVAKLKESFLEAQEEIRFALREGFKDLVSHAIDRLTPGPDGKRKIFCESTFEKFTEFFETFNARNLLEDEELEAVVAQAKEIVAGLSVDDLRNEESRRLLALIKSNQKKAQIAELAGDAVALQRSNAKVAELQQELEEQNRANDSLLKSTIEEFSKVDAVLAPLVLTPNRRFNFEE